MRRNQLLLAPMFLGLLAGASACQIDSAEFREGDLGSTQQATIGGSPSPGGGATAHHDAVAAITVLLPSGDNNQARTEHRYCTGVLVEEFTVMTAAGCLSANLEAELDPEFTDDFLDPASVFIQFGASIGGTTEYVLDADFNEDPMSVKGLTMHRYYDPDLRGQNDIALLRLSTSPGITPVAIHADPLGQDLVGQDIELVGYGKQDGGNEPVEAFTARSVVVTPIVSVGEDRLKAGTNEATTCYADGGGPGFVDFGSGPEVVSVTVTQKECDDNVNRQRVDRHANEFLLPFIKYISGGCAGDACDPCDYNGACEEDCPTRDWDCAIGSFVGKGCVLDGDCEELGACIAATDDPTFTYCDKPCDPTDSAACPSGMQCSEDGNRCEYVGISPGSQGAACSSPSECRSGFCENSFCAFECDPNDASACNEDDGFFCLPALEEASTTVCRIEARTGGGGFCHASASPHMHADERNSLLAGLGLLMLLGFVRRRRRN